MIHKKTINTLLAGAVAVTAAGMASSASAAMDKDQEKCYGVVKAGKNDCGAADKSHGCGGMAKVDGSSQEWIALPKGVCEKLVNGSLTPVAAKAEETKAEKEAKEDHKAKADENDHEMKEDHEGAAE